MIPMNKVEIAAYRYLGVVGSCFSLFQASIWLVLAFVGAICKYAACGSTGSKRTYKYCFYMMYYFEPKNYTANFTRVNFINPTFFHGIMWFNILLCIVNIVVSIFMAKAFIEWKKARWIKKIAYIWIRCILAFSILELIMFIIFASDIASINNNNDIKCLLETNLTLLQSSYARERTPAPYLLQLKSNLKTFRKKIRQYNRNLVFLDAVFNEESPDHVKNPFISKKVVDNHVEDIWSSMFNNSIREKKVRRRTDELPSDQMMQYFIASKELELDDLDFDLLKNFDGLTHQKYTKPIRSSNVVFGREYNLSSSITANDSVELDKIALLLHEYLKSINGTPPNNYSEADQNFFDFVNQTVFELEKEETYKDKIESILNGNDYLANYNTSLPLDAANDKEEFLWSLRKSFESMLEPQEENERGREINNQNMQTVIYRMREFLENNKVSKLNDEQILKTIRESLKYQTEEPISIKDGMKGILKWRKVDAPSEEAKDDEGDDKLPDKNHLVKELCDNCAYFILGPSIVCMILSLKTGLVWLLNITIAILLYLYGRKIKLKKKFIFFPCFSRKK